MSAGFIGSFVKYVQHCDVFFVIYSCPQGIIVPHAICVQESRQSFNMLRVFIVMYDYFNGNSEAESLTWKSLAHFQEFKLPISPQK